MQRAAVKHDQRVCLTLEFLWSVFPATSFIAQYFKDQGLTQSQIFGLQVVITSVMVLTDIPLGYIADKFSLRCIVITGMIIQVVQSVYFLWCQSFWQFEISYVMSGLYLSALSNTTSTIMTQSVSRITDVTARAQAYSEYEKHRIGIRSYAFFVGAIVGSVLVAAGTTTWPFLVQPFVYTIGLVVGLSTLKLPRHFVAAKRRTRISIRAALRRTLKNRPDIRYVILLTAIVQMEGFACLWLFQPRTQHTGMPVWLFGAVYIIRSVAILVLQRTNLMKRISPRIMWPCLLVSMPVGAFT
ncbi:MAG TPA: MFS transporter, partial [Candidatus Saccharimonas sp.]|nr:MFS transporter [Candidatus Saccharimonas sp.]